MTATVTIGSFSCSTLTAQPYGYEGEPSEGLTARTFRVSGLLTPAQWSTFLSTYNTWRTTRINDPDTLYSGQIGTTVSLSVNNVNSISVTNLACWFTDTPTGEQVGAYISATAILVDAAEALAVLQRALAKQKQRSIAEQRLTNCDEVDARLERQADEADCEIAALQTGYADTFATQALTKQNIETGARAAAYSDNTSTVQNIKASEASLELVEKQANLAARTAYATDIATADLALQTQDATAKASAYTAGTDDLADLKTAEATIELRDKQATVTARQTLADDLATADLTLQALEAAGRATAYAANTSTVEDIKASEASLELVEKQANLTARTSYATDLAAADLALQALEAAGRATAYAANTSALTTIQSSELSVEKLQAAAKISALNSGTNLADIKAARALQAIYDRYISEDIPDLGSVTVGTCTIKLLKPMATYSDGPQVSMAASGTSLITGALKAHETRRIEGILTSGTYDTLVSWYGTTVLSTPAAGAWFPTVPPTGTAEKFLVNGAVATRYSVSLELKKIV